MGVRCHEPACIPRGELDGVSRVLAVVVVLVAGVFYFLDTYAVNQSESTKDHTTFELTNQNAKLHSFSGSFTFGNSRNLSLKSCQKYASSNNYGMYILTQMLTNISHILRIHSKAICNSIY